MGVGKRQPNHDDTPSKLVLEVNAFTELATNHAQQQRPPLAFCNAAAVGLKNCINRANFMRFSENLLLDFELGQDSELVPRVVQFLLVVVRRQEQDHPVGAHVAKVKHHLTELFHQLWAKMRVCTVLERKVQWDARRAFANGQRE